MRRLVLGLLAIDVALGIVLHFGLEAVTIDGTGYGETLSAAVHANRSLALDAEVRTLGERLQMARLWGFVPWAVAWIGDCASKRESAVIAVARLSWGGRMR